MKLKSVSLYNPSRDVLGYVIPGEGGEWGDIKYRFTLQWKLYFPDTGLKLEGKKRYSQLVDKPFHISHAVLAPELGYETVLVEVHAIVEKTDYIICILDGRSNIQQSLDLNISEGEEIVLYTTETNTVYLTGYFIEEPVFPQGLEELTNDEYSDLQEMDSLGVSSLEEEEEGETEPSLATLLFEGSLASDESDEEFVAGPSLRALPPQIEEINEEEGEVPCAVIKVVYFLVCVVHWLAITFVCVERA